MVKGHLPPGHLPPDKSLMDNSALDISPHDNLPPPFGQVPHTKNALYGMGPMGGFGGLPPTWRVMSGGIVRGTCRGEMSWGKCPRTI